MSMTPDDPEEKEPSDPEISPTPRWVFVVFIIIFVLVGYLLFAGHAARTQLQADLAKANERANILAAQMEQTNSRLADLKGQLEVTSQKLGLTQEELARARSLAQTIRKDQKASDERLAAQLGQVKQESEAKIGQVSSEVSGAKSDIEAARKDLEATRTKLERTIGDLGVQSGLIARNREEVEELKRRGERNIFEFDLHKSKTPQRVGPAQLTLQKVDAKHFRYTMTVYADDKAIQKKDKTVNEPVQFYVKGVRIPYEIVVFELAKDRATGYLSTPKELAALKPAQ
jgi:outer membrane murein-binding lipoprotein Lpp